MKLRYPFLGLLFRTVLGLIISLLIVNFFLTGAIEGRRFPSFSRYLDNLIQGFSFRSTFVYSDINVLVPFFWSMVLIGMAMIISILLAIPLGIRFGTSSNSFAKSIIHVFSILSTVPEFWLLVLFVIVIFRGIVPSTGDGVEVALMQYKEGQLSLMGFLREFAVYVTVPCIILVLKLFPVMLSYVGSAASVAMKKEYIVNMKARGMAKRYLLWKHVLRTVAGDFTSNLLYEISAFITTLAVVERIYNWPGMGRLYIRFLEEHAVSQVFRTNVLIAAVVFLALFFGYSYLFRRNPKLLHKR